MIITTKKTTKHSRLCLNNKYMNLDTYSDKRSRDSYNIGRNEFDSAILEHVKLSDNSTVLEVGCGDGRFIRNLIKTNHTLIITGLDASAAGINCCKDIGCDLICSDILNYDPNKKYDYVLCFQTLEHFSSPDEVIEKLKSLGKNIIVSVPNKEMDKCTDHIQFWDVSEFELYMNTYINGKAILIDSNQNILFISEIL